MSRSLSVLVLVAAVAILALTVTACGKKGPPKPPDEDKISSVSLPGSQQAPEPLFLGS